MADDIRIVDSYMTFLGDEPGEGRRLLEHISEQGVNLRAFTAFPAEGGRTQLAFVTDRTDKLHEAASDAGVALDGPHKAFLIHGQDRIGALHQHHLTLANARVNVLASSCLGDDAGGFGFILWVRPEDFEKAAWAFGFV